jgi:tetratricopeptide (TPR) repeat protein
VRVVALLVLAVLSLSAQPAGTFSRIRTLRQQLAAGADREDLHTSLAVEYLLLGQENLFQTEIASALRLNPQSAQAHYLLGRYEWEVKQDPAKAVVSFRQALDSTPDSFKSEYFLGLCYRSLGQVEEARRHLLSAASRSDYDWPWRALADLELEQGARTEAAAAIVNALRKGPQDPANHLLAAKIYRSSGDNEKAVAALRRCIELDPTLPAPHYLLSQIYSASPATRALAARELARFADLKDGDK